MPVVFEGVEQARLALDDIEREIGPADGGQIGQLAPTDGETSPVAIAAVRVLREHAPVAREILTRGGGQLVADIDAARAEWSPSPAGDAPGRGPGS